MSSESRRATQTIQFSRAHTASQSPQGLLQAQKPFQPMPLFKQGAAQASEDFLPQLANAPVYGCETASQPLAKAHKFLGLSHSTCGVFGKAIGTD